MTFSFFFLIFCFETVYVVSGYVVKDFTTFATQVWKLVGEFQDEKLSQPFRQMEKIYFICALGVSLRCVHTSNSRFFFLNCSKIPM